MSNQSLQEFQAAFGTTPVEMELPAKLAKDGFSTVYLKPLSSAARDNFEASVVGLEGKGRDLRNLRARLVATCWCNADGALMGTEKQIGELRADLIGGLFDLVRTMNGMDADEVAEAKNA